MNICIIGWYGSETLGDRSILLGLSRIFNETYGKCKIFLGSFNAFYSERCLEEDKVFFEILAPMVEIELFNSRVKNTLKWIIEKSDMIVMGGGPIMDLQELLMIRFAFEYAKRKNKKTALLGCGVGPIFDNFYKKIAVDIFQHSDLSILRDPISVSTANVIARDFKCNLQIPLFHLHDPAIIPIGVFLESNYKAVPNNNLIINLRDYPAAAFKTSKKSDIDKEFAE